MGHAIQDTRYTIHDTHITLSHGTYENSRLVGLLAQAQRGIFQAMIGTLGRFGLSPTLRRNLPRTCIRHCHSIESHKHHTAV